MSEERDFTQLTDEEVMNLGPADFERMAAAEEAKSQESDEEENKEPVEEEEQEDQESDKEEEETSEDSEDDGEDQGEEEEGSDTEEPSKSDEEVIAEGEPAPAKPKGKVKEPKTPAEPKDTKVDGFDADGAKKLFEPFKANGRTMSIRNADEGIRLMQLGAGYNAKMEELRPKMAIVRTLEREGLLDNDKLSFLIDLHKKNPEAIGKLVKDSGVDVLDLDETKVGAYKPGVYQTSTKELEMDEVLDGLKHSKSYSVLMDTVANKWDKESKSEVGNNPVILKTINDHMDLGFYDKIVDEVNRKKALGEIASGTPFLAAYAKVGDELNAAGAFGATTPAPKSKLVSPGKEKARSTRNENEQRRKAAAPTRTSGNPTPKKPVTDVWNMSDDDFEKQFKPR